MKLIFNELDFISQETINQCFGYNVHNYVDKVITGNGFSTAFLKTVPPKGKINIMIAPNRAVVKDTEVSVLKYDTENTYSFFYKDSIDKSLDSSVLVFVLDSFVLMKDKLYEIRNRINWILIDEAHAIEI